MKLHIPKGYKILKRGQNIIGIFKENFPQELFDKSLELIYKFQSDTFQPLYGGRNRVFILNKNNNLSIVVKIYSHGGIFKYPFFNESFFSNRFLKEFRLYTDVLYNKLPVPEYYGGFWLKKFGLYRCVVITQYIPDTYTLEQFLNNRTFSLTEKLDVVKHCGKIIKDMHNLGVYHNDLQIRNILIHLSDKSVYLIDFDNAKKYSHLNIFLRSLNLLRLKRSFVKRKIDTNYFDILINSYGIDKLSFTAKLLSYPHIKWIYLKNHLYKYFHKDI